MSNERIGSRGRFDATTLQGLTQQLNAALGNLGAGAAQVNGVRLDLQGAAPTAAPQDAGSPNIILASVGGVYKLHWWSGSAWVTPLTVGVTGSGTTGVLPKWTSSTGLGDSILSEAAGLITAAGGFSVTGSLTIGSDTAPDATSLVLNTAAGAYSNIRFLRTSLSRWIWEADDVAESGGNVGTDLTLYRYNDAGAGAAAAVTIRRSDGRWLFENEARAARFAVDGAAWISAAGGPDWISFFVSSTNVWDIQNSGHFIPHADVAYDLGAAAKRVRTIYAQQLAGGSTGSMVSSSGTVLQIGGGSSWTQLNLYSDAVARWHVVTGGHFRAVTDNAYDIGATGALRPRDLYLAGQLKLEGSAPAVRVTNTVANSTVATTLGSTGPTGSTAGAPRGWLPISVAGTTRYVPFW